MLAFSNMFPPVHEHLSRALLSQRLAVHKVSVSKHLRPLAVLISYSSCHAQNHLNNKYQAPKEKGNETDGNDDSNLLNKKERQTEALIARWKEREREREREREIGAHGT